MSFLLFSRLQNPSIVLFVCYLHNWNCFPFYISPLSFLHIQIKRGGNGDSHSHCLSCQTAKFPFFRRKISSWGVKEETKKHFMAPSGKVSLHHFLWRPLVSIVLVSFWLLKDVRRTMECVHIYFISYENIDFSFLPAASLYNASNLTLRGKSVWILFCEQFLPACWIHLNI